MSAKSKIPPSEPLKIMVVATPKSGNHWLKSLLSEMYSLPMVPAADWRTHERWVGHDHFWPEDGILDWFHRDGITPVTITRHPFDVLVSLYHHIWMKTDVPVYEQCVLRDKDHIGEGTLEYVRSQFYSLLLISEAWRKLGVRSVRFEDLLANPIDTLRSLSESVGSADETAIQRSICCSSFPMMRGGFEPNAQIKTETNFFRKGGSGYRHEIPDEIVSVLSSGPFRRLMTEQGYAPDMDPVQPFDITPIDPFQGHRLFSNGAYISAKLYRVLMQIPDLLRRWPKPWESSADQSLFNWLNSRVAGQPITNLMTLIYHRRVDLMTKFPLETRARDLCLWFLTYASYEYDFGPEFLEPVLTLVQETPDLQRTF